MRIIIKRIFSLTLILSLILGMAPGSAAVALTEQQSNAIAMLNYITILTQEINASKNSRVFMEQAYTSLINNGNL